MKSFLKLLQKKTAETKLEPLDDKNFQRLLSTKELAEAKITSIADILKLESVITDISKQLMDKAIEQIKLQQAKGQPIKPQRFIINEVLDLKEKKKILFITPSFPLPVNTKLDERKKAEKELASGEAKPFIINDKNFFVLVGLDEPYTAHKFAFACHSAHDPQFPPGYNEKNYPRQGLSLTLTVNEKGEIVFELENRSTLNFIYALNPAAESMFYFYPGQGFIISKDSLAWDNARGLPPPLTLQDAALLEKKFGNKVGVSQCENLEYAKKFEEMKPEEQAKELAHTIYIASGLQKATQMPGFGTANLTHFEPHDIIVEKAISVAKQKKLALNLEYKPVDQSGEFQGATALIHAAKSHNKKVVAILLREGAKTEARDELGATALHYAVQNNDLETIKILIKYKADVNAPNKKGLTPLKIATTSKASEEIIKLLEKNGAKMDVTYNPDAFLTKEELLKKSVLGRADSDDDKDTLEHDDFEEVLIPLHEAIKENNNKEIIKLLENKSTPLASHTMMIKSPGIINEQDNQHGYTPLHYAVIYAKTDTINLLLEKKANPNIQDLDENTPLHLAAQKGKIDVVVLLLKNGADKGIRNNEDKTPLEAAEEVLGEEAYKKLKKVFAITQSLRR